jgi:hypothetical protein
MIQIDFVFLGKHKNIRNIKISRLSWPASLPLPVFIGIGKLVSTAKTNYYSSSIENAGLENKKLFHTHYLSLSSVM